MTVPMSPIDVVAVDDEPTTRDLVSGVLRRAGMTVQTCANGDEMWRAVDVHHPGVVILDVEMPGENGFLLAERLRARYGLGVSIIMLTSHGKDCDKAVGMDAGVDDFLTKPCDWAQLTGLVRRYLDASHRQL